MLWIPRGPVSLINRDEELFERQKQLSWFGYAESDSGTASSDEVDYKGNHGKDQQDMNQEPCHVKSEKTARP